ncbi:MULTISPECIES: glycosyltransferase family 4 protein [unclassified Adlercreutzia]|uniref:glycosyltransferase family 4 protein n=1 Tax=unclassified Adlercreutzia TaxID=2636013 RepID=UPI0013ED368A|nr:MULTISPECIES: glycosyltransferase family 4 protein [unclassified Adlercreutzia]
MKILKMPAYCDPEQYSSLHLNHDLDEGFAKAGFDTLKIAPQPTRGVDEETWRKYTSVSSETMLDGHVVVERFPMCREGRNPVKRAMRYLFVNIKQEIRAKKIQDADVIFASSTPPIQGLMCARVKKALGVPMVYNLQDIFPDSLVNAGMTKEGSLIWRIGRRIENKTYRNADRIIVISESFKCNIMAKGVPESKIDVVPNWIDSSDVFPVPRDENKLFERLDVDTGCFYVCYSGNIGHSQDFDLLLDAAKILRSEIPDLRFVIFGDGVAKRKLVARIEEESLSNVLCFPFQSYEDIPEVFSFGDVGLVISKSGIGRSSIPSKTWSIMAAGRPVLASFDLDSELCRLVKDVRCGVCSEAGSIGSFLRSVRYLYEDRESSVRMGEAGRAYIIEELSKEKCVGAYVDSVLRTIEGFRKTPSDC